MRAMIEADGAYASEADQVPEGGRAKPQCCVTSAVNIAEFESALTTNLDNPLSLSNAKPGPGDRLMPGVNRAEGARKETCL